MIYRQHATISVGQCSFRNIAGGLLCCLAVALGSSSVSGASASEAVPGRNEILSEIKAIFERQRSCERVSPGMLTGQVCHNQTSGFQFYKDRDKIVFSSVMTIYCTGASYLPSETVQVEFNPADVVAVPDRDLAFACDPKTPCIWWSRTGSLQVREGIRTCDKAVIPRLTGAVARLKSLTSPTRSPSR